MVARVYSAVISGPAVQPVMIEVEGSATSLPTVSLIGLPNASVIESKDRVFSALRSLRLSLPHKRLVISLRPVEVPKSGSSLDLAIALGILAVFRLIPNRSYAAVGELGLDGALHANREYLALLDELARHRKVYTAGECLGLAIQPLAGRSIFPCATLQELYLGLSGTSCLLPLAKLLDRAAAPPPAVELPPEGMTISRQLLRALTLSLAGGHHLLLFGSPGVGKTYSRQLLSYLLPEETESQTWERQVRESIGALAKVEPGRVVSPHHNATVAGLIGGGRPIRSGAVSLAHRGILFLDEFPEFRRECLEALRQPLENEQLTLVRGGGAWTLPCSFTMIATANPCPCGFYGTDQCHCRDSEVKRYVEQISGPVLDRIDLQVRVIAEDRTALSSEEVAQLRRQITAARRRQESRMAQGWPEFARLYEKDELQRLGEVPEKVLAPRMTREWSLRRKIKLWRVAQTIADLENNAQIIPKYVREAYQFARPAFAEIIQ
jgi:magnesium chelatase family protein